MISVVDYGMGNVGSVLNMLKRIGVAAHRATTPDDLGSATKIILPGVGAFDAATAQLDRTGLREVIVHKAQIERIPILGICLGMQLLSRSSEEGASSGLGLIPAETKRLPVVEGVKIPHMGWNTVRLSERSKLTAGLGDDTRFYFVHSYHVACDRPEHVLMECVHGIRFTAAVHNENVFGAQFHPEKSHRFGRVLLENFAAI